MIPFFNIASATPFIYAMDFYNLVFVTTLATGFSFTMPVFFVLLVRFGIVKTEYVTRRRRYIYAAMYVITAVVTPDGGPLADLALFIPMIVLLELAVVFGKRYEKTGRITDRVAERQKSAKPVGLKCKYCGGLIFSRAGFCSTCGKAQV
jgi:Sec-independent protein secretion pathway component TatC